MKKELVINYIDINELTPYANNSRTHSDEQVNQIVASIKEWGFTNPILIDERNGIIAGHGRLLAAMLLNMDTIPTITLTGLTDEQKRAYVIADNKLALNSEWDYTLLKSEVESLVDIDLELLGFDGDELNLILHGVDEEPLAEIEHDDAFDEQRYTLLVEYDTEQQLQVAFEEAQRKGFQCKILD